mgnify:CR=1 FL=1
MKYGFVNVAAAVPAVKVADTAYNLSLKHISEQTSLLSKTYAGFC